MLSEFKRVRQIPGESRRRWFWAEGMDLIVWYGKGAEITGFQLCFEDGGGSKAFTWDDSSGGLFYGVDDGDTCYGKHKKSPVLVPDDLFQRDQLIALFSRECPGVPDEIVALALSKLEELKPGR